MSDKLKVGLAYLLIALSGVFASFGNSNGPIFTLFDWVCFIPGLILLYSTVKEENGNYHTIFNLLVWLGSFIIAYLIRK